jgi:hypothetical protein
MSSSAEDVAFDEQYCAEAELTPKRTTIIRLKALDILESPW